MWGGGVRDELPGAEEDRGENGKEPQRGSLTFGCKEDPENEPFPSLSFLLCKMGINGPSCKTLHISSPQLRLPQCSAWMVITTSPVERFFGLLNSGTVGVEVTPFSDTAQPQTVGFSHAGGSQATERC